MRITAELSGPEGACEAFKEASGSGPGKTVDVIFKREAARVIALLPGEPWSDSLSGADCACYTVGEGWSGASLAYARDLPPARAFQFEALRAGLESLGFKLRVARRFTKYHAAERGEKLRLRREGAGRVG